MPTQARTMQQVGNQIEQCITLCQQCHEICTRMITRGLELNNEQPETTHIRLLRDCAEICLTAANFMSRSSELHSTVCSSCAEVCLRCAVDCEQLEDDEQMKACAEACRRCAESCQMMVANATATGKT